MEERPTIAHEDSTNPAFLVRVTVVEGPSAGQAFDVTRFPSVLGRGKDADVQVPDDPDDPRLSRQHVRIGLEGGSITVEDVSTNGTWVGEHKLSPRQPVMVGEDAHLRLGPRTILRVEVVPDIPQAQAPTPSPASWLKSLVQPLTRPKTPAQTSVVEVRALGAFQLTGNGVPVPSEAWQHRKAVVLLVHLVELGQPTSADRLWEVLWPEASDGRQAVQTAVSRVRKALRSSETGLPELIRFERKLYGIEPTCTVWYDVAEFEQWVGEAQRRWQQKDLAGTGQALELAIDLYRGPFLEGHEEPWVERRRTYLERRWFEAMETLGALREEESRPEEASRVYQRLLERDAGREQAHIGLVRSLAALGRRDDALRQCTNSITTLRKVLNLPPGPEMEALYKSLTGSGA